jgi:hypothetical protein
MRIADRVTVLRDGKTPNTVPTPPMRLVPPKELEVFCRAAGVEFVDLSK